MSSPGIYKNARGILKPKPLTAETLAYRADSIGGDIDECRWKLAELSLEAKEAGILGWAEILSKRPKVRRSVRTIRDYARTAEFRRAIGGHIFDLPYSFYSRAAQTVDHLTPETIATEMRIAAEGDTTYEMFSAVLSDAVKGDAPPTLLPPLAEAFRVVVDAVADLAGRDDLPEPARVVVAGVADALRAAMGMLVGPLTKVQ